MLRCTVVATSTPAAVLARMERAAGDVVVGFNGRPITKGSELNAALDSLADASVVSALPACCTSACCSRSVKLSCEVSDGAQAELKVVRGEDRLTLSIPLDS